MRSERELAAAVAAACARSLVLSELARTRERFAPAVRARSGKLAPAAWARRSPSSGAAGA